MKSFKIKYDRQTKTYAAIDPETGYASQGKTKIQAKANLIEALRLVILTYQEIRKL